ncbi:maestro heat-like repeat family member 5, partial [Empidonax traillii]|uniref:maestro heat-like repeat family member 5 n=1 Tax=Empidonax traillii TaxID=164674 RepID=UPI000FFD7B67
WQLSHSPLLLLQVPAIVRYIHQCLTFHLSPDVRQHIDIRRLADRNPHEVVMTLLGCAPECDRAAAVMWSSIASSRTAMEKVLPTLLGAMQDWPVHSMSSSDADNNTAIFALAATLALWHIIQETECEEAMINHAPHLLLSLLFQISMSTEQMSEEVDAFWRQCQEEHGLPKNPNRFAVQTLKALLCCLHWENEVVAIERKRGWETLLCLDTHHYAVGLLAREMRRVLVPFHCEMAIDLLRMLSREEPHWELPALAFLVEILDYLDGRKCHDTVLPILSRNLQILCPERQRLALRGLLVLSVDPLMADSICSLAENLLELLRHEDVEMVEMTLSVFLNMLQDEDLQAFGSAALKLAEALQPLFDNDNSHVQLLSIRLFREVMELVVEEGKETLVHQSLVPLLFHCHDETQCVAEMDKDMS